MRFIVRWAFRLFVLLVVLVVALVLLKDTLVRALAESSIRSATGLEAKIDKFEVGLLTPTLTIENFTLYNSADFGGAPFVIIPELHVEYDVAAAALGKIHLTLVRFNLGEIDIVQDKGGKWNYQELQAALAKRASDKSVKPTADFTGIDTLNLTLGAVKYTSLKPGGKTWKRDLRIKNEILQNIKSTSDLDAAILKVLLRRGLSLAGDWPQSDRAGRKPGQDVGSFVGGLVAPSKK
ncbi:MAG: hypothetical protein KGS61_12970 [Verrucomicrobia bacterium]|nr:hypothetical protein [Verrucomicrobiota bacterium]